MRRSAPAAPEHGPYVNALFLIGSIRLLADPVTSAPPVTLVSIWERGASSDL